MRAPTVWKTRALDAELLLQLLQCGAAQFDPDTKELRFDGLRYSGNDKDWSLLLNVAGRDRVRAAIEKSGAK